MDKGVAHLRHDLTDEKWALLEPQLQGVRAHGRTGEGQLAILECSVLDFEDGLTMTRFVAELRRLGEHTLAFFPVAQQRDVGKAATAPGGRCGL